MGERAKSEKPLGCADFGQLNINKEKISSKKRHHRRTEREGEIERERGVCFVTVVDQVKERRLEIKSGAAINAISEFKIEKYKYIYAKEKEKKKKKKK